MIVSQVQQSMNGGRIVFLIRRWYTQCPDCKQ